VELALALPVVVLALLLVVQVALVARAQVLVVHAAREGARAASVGEPAAAAARATPGLEPGRLAVHQGGGGTAGALVTVSVAYRAATEVPLVGGLLGDVTVRRTSRCGWRVPPDRPQQAGGGVLVERFVPAPALG
jgi:hypothetical protein